RSQFAGSLQVPLSGNVGKLTAVIAAARPARANAQSSAATPRARAGSGAVKCECDMGAEAGWLWINLVDAGDVAGTQLGGAPEFFASRARFQRRPTAPRQKRPSTTRGTAEAERR